MAQADTSDWIEWTGGECPVSPGQRYAYRARDGFECADIIADEDHCRSAVWAHVEHSAGWDIVAYRVLAA